MSLLIQSPGLLTTVQDAGCFGAQAFGMGTSGCMDQQAFRNANAMVGNPSGEDAVLECTLIGPEILFTTDTVCAIAGADMQVNVRGVPVPRERAFVVLAGQTLRFGAAVEGCRAYLAVRGGIGVPVVMGSRSTNLKCGVGGYQGRALRGGDELQPGSEAHCGPCMPLKTVPHYENDIAVHVVCGPQAACFTSAGLETLRSAKYTVTQDSDRMGIRLEGPMLAHQGVDIVSDGIVFGSVQVPANGKPIILMADHQTTGGYAKIATVCSFDLPGLAQLVPGGTVRFLPVTVRQAQKMLRKKRKEEA